MDTKCSSGTKPSGFRNVRKHKVDFSTVTQSDWNRALIVEDDRREYGEKRYWAFVLFEARLHVVVFVRRGAVRRLISARKANSREVRFYEAEIDRSLRPKTGEIAAGIASDPDAAPDFGNGLPLELSVARKSLHPEALNISPSTPTFRAFRATGPGW